MKLLTPKQRQELIERVALKYYPEEGIEKLAEVVSIKQYLPLYHFEIFHPSAEQNIFVTELFGNQIFGQPSLGQVAGQRLQYFGGYNGLNSVLCQWITFPMIAPENNFYHEKTVFGKDLKLSKRERISNALQLIDEQTRYEAGHPLSLNPSFTPLGTGENIDRLLKENFDKSLIYLYQLIGFLNVDPRKLKDLAGKQFSATYHVL